MDKKDLIGFVLKDIKELELIVRGMYEMDKIPEVVQELVISKTKGILDYFSKISVEKTKNDFPEIKMPEQKEPEREKEPKKEREKEPEKVTTNEKFKPPSLHATVATGKKAESRFVHSLRKAINLNDRYRYQRDLFRGNIELMNQVVEKLDTLKTLSEAMDYVQREFSWDAQSETVADFYTLLENRFS